MAQLSLFETESERKEPEAPALSALVQQNQDTYIQSFPDDTLRVYQRVQVPHVKFRKSNYPPTESGIQSRSVWRVSLKVDGVRSLLHWHKGYYPTLLDAFEAFNKSEMIP